MAVFVLSLCHEAVEAYRYYLHIVPGARSNTFRYPPGPLSRIPHLSLVGNFQMIWIRRVLDVFTSHLTVNGRWQLFTTVYKMMFIFSGAERVEQLPVTLSTSSNPSVTGGGMEDVGSLSRDTPESETHPRYVWQRCGL